MTEAGPSRLPLRAVIHRRHHIQPPAHHVVVQANTAGQAILDSLPSFPSILPPSQPEQLYSSEKTSVFINSGPQENPRNLKRSNTDLNESSSDSQINQEKLIRTGFQNPWQSWHKPTLSEVWNGLHWTQSGEEPKHKGHTEFEAYRTAIEHARKKESGEEVEDDEIDKDLNSSRTNLLNDKGEKSLEENDLQSHRPDFTITSKDSNMVKATWLGHATVLLQLPPSKKGQEPIRILFDPIFSQRCSPTQYVGPSRLYPAPCSIADLPNIDLVCISHSHYDHLDYDSILQLWHANSDHLRFAVPLGNKSWFLGLGLNIDEERISELDWWDEVWLSNGENDFDKVDDERKTRIVCTPAQHGSGRYGFDAGKSLWSSWTIEFTPNPKSKPFRAFFGGDTGFQFHSSAAQSTEYPTCPAFAEVQKELGSPHLSFLPISVGATFNFVKSYDAFGVVPEMDGGLTGANHMTPFDAVRVSRILANKPGKQDCGDDDNSKKPKNGSSDVEQPVVMAIHWGTFVSGMDEVRRSMRDLEYACVAQDVLYVRKYGQQDEKTTKSDKSSKDQDLITFACIDHGQSIWVKF